MIDVEALKKQILLQGLTDKDYELLAPRLELRRYEKMSAIFTEGESQQGIYLVHKGRVRISKSLPAGRSKTLVIFREGNYFGDLSALEKGWHSANATALTQAELFLLALERLENSSLEELALSCKILKRLALIAGKNLRQMNVKYLRLRGAF